MNIVNIHQAKTHLSRLIEKAARGESFVIAKSGKPMVKVVPIDSPTARTRLGFMTGQIVVPDDFDELFSKEIEQLFGGSP